MGRERITEKMLYRRLAVINEVMGQNPEPYEKVEGGVRANVGTYLLDWAYGGVALCRLTNDGGAEANVIPRGTNRVTFDRMDAFLEGVRAAKGMHK